MTGHALARVGAAGLAAFGVRRAVFLAALLVARPRPGAGRPEEESPGRGAVCVIVPARDAAGELDATLAALAEAEPAVQVTIVDDGSRDATAEVSSRWAAEHAGWSLLRLPVARGKAGALNAALAGTGETEFVTVCDADVQVPPGALRALLRALGEPGVAAASGLLWPANPQAGPVARYCALELWQHQLITSAAKDRLGLGPPVHGWFAVYRREALASVGGFPEQSLGEDVEVSRDLVAGGWRTRFIAAAVVRTAVPETVGGYLHQHLRWARGLHDAMPLRRRFRRGRSGGGGRPGTVTRAGVPAIVHVEQWLHAAGYLDRPLWLMSLALAHQRRLPRAVPVGYAALLALESAAALGRAGQLRRGPAFLTAAAAVLPLDILVSVAGSGMALARRPRRWGRGETPHRAPAAQ